MKRKWRENEEIERKWRENEEMSFSFHFLILFPFPHSLSISSFSIQFLILSPFPLNFLISSQFPPHILILSPFPRSPAGRLQQLMQSWLQSWLLGGTTCNAMQVLHCNIGLLVSSVCIELVSSSISSQLLENVTMYIGWKAPCKRTQASMLPHKCMCHCKKLQHTTGILLQCREDVTYTLQSLPSSAEHHPNSQK